MKSEYSNSINYFDWPREWHYDPQDEEQLEVDRQSLLEEIKFLKGFYHHGTKESIVVFPES